MANSAEILAGRMRHRLPHSETARFVVLFWRNGAAVEGTEVFGTRFTSDEAADEWARKMFASQPERWSSYEITFVL